MKCKITITPRNKRTHWLVVETETFAILQIRSKEHFHMHLETKEGYLKTTEIENKLQIDLIIRDAQNYKQTYEMINRSTIKKKQYINFCKQFGTSELIVKFENYFKLNNNER